MKPNYDFNIFCKNFSIIRKSRSLTFKDISDHTGINHFDLLYIEAGLDPESVNCKTLLTLCEFFEISLDDFFTPVN